MGVYLKLRITVIRLIVLALTSATVWADIDTETDLPAMGRSLFDRLVEKNGGIVPYPPGKLYRLLRENSHGEITLLGVSNGRSLSRFETNNQNPRWLMSISPQVRIEGQSTSKNSLNLRAGDVFIGYTKESKTLEIVSYNEALNRFEFQFVEDYGFKKTPKVQYAARALCTSCHQNKGPIFGGGNWLETRKPSATELKHLGIVLSPEAARYANNTHAWGFLGTDYAASVVHGGNRLNAHKIIQHLCGQAPARAVCIEKLIRASIAYAVDTDLGRAKFKKITESILRSELQTPVELPWHIIKEFNPIADSGIISSDQNPLKSRENKFIFFEPATEPMPHLRTPLVDNVFFDKMQTHVAMNDIEILKIISYLADKKEIVAIKKLSNLSDEKFIETIISAPSGIFAQNFESKTATIGDTLRKILKQPIQNSFSIDREVKEIEVAAYELRNAASKIMKTSDPLDSFKKYCTACHAGNPVNFLNFMSASTDEELLKNLKSLPNLDERLNPRGPIEKRMPPVHSSQASAMKEAQALSQMRAFVQSDCELVFKSVKNLKSATLKVL